MGICISKPLFAAAKVRHSVVVPIISPASFVKNVTEISVCRLIAYFPFILQ